MFILLGYNIYIYISAERRSEALRNLQTTREALHDAHQRTMGQDVLATNDIDSAQEALDATMTVEESDSTGMQSSFAQIKENLNGVVMQVRNTIEDRIKKRARSRSRGKPREGSPESQEVEVMEPTDKKVRDSN